MKQTIKLNESELKRMIFESVKKALNEGEPDLYDILSRPEGKLDLSNPYTWAKSPKRLKDMGYDENGMRRGKKYYDKLLNPNWAFNKNNFHGIDYALGSNKEAEADIADAEKKQKEKDERWQKSADSRPLHRKGSLNRAMDESINRIVSQTLRKHIR